MSGTDCLHGRASRLTAAQLNQHPVIALLREYSTNDDDDPFEISTVFTRSHPELMNEEFITFLHGLAADYALNGRTPTAYMLTMLAVQVRAKVDRDADQPAGLSDDDRLRRLVAVQNSIDCEPKAIKYLHKKLPCDCLKAVGRQLLSKQGKTFLCQNCEKRFPRTMQNDCSACACVSYCSKECQVANWKEHKTMCKFVQGKK